MILAINTIMKAGRLLCHYTMYYGLVYYLILEKCLKPSALLNRNNIKNMTTSASRIIHVNCSQS
jgi:dipeptide/tripeptide permease